MNAFNEQCWMSALPAKAVRAHVIKNHLSVIFAIAWLLEKEEIPFVVRRRLERLTYAARQVNELVNDDLLAERPEQVAVASATHAAIAERVREKLEDRAASAGVMLRLDVGPGMVQGRLDELVEALANLVGNAITASPHAATVTVRALCDGGISHWTICDGGCGMGPEQVASFGKPFCSTFAGGSGVGVAFAREIVACHGGSMSVESEIGKGTSVTVRLPIDGGRDGRS